MLNMAPVLIFVLLVIGLYYPVFSQINSLIVGIIMTVLLLYLMRKRRRLTKKTLKNQPGPSDNRWYAYAYRHVDGDTREFKILAESREEADTKAQSEFSFLTENRLARDRNLYPMS